MICPSVVQQDVSIDHIPCPHVCTYIRVHQASSGGSNQVLRHVCGIFQVIRPYSRLSRSRYSTGDVGVDPLASPCCGNQHRRYLFGQ